MKSKDTVEVIKKNMKQVKIASMTGGVQPELWHLVLSASEQAACNRRVKQRFYRSRGVRSFSSRRGHMGGRQECGVGEERETVKNREDWIKILRNRIWI